MTYKEGLWSSTDEWAAEIEVGDFLYGLVRLTKPILVLETGCYNGDSSYRIAEALKENGVGTLNTCDTDRTKVDETKKRVNGLEVRVHHCSGYDLARTIAKVNIAFLDSSGDRTEEALALNMTSPGWVVLDDAKRDTYRQIETKLGWRSIYFTTPRGLALFAI